MNFFYRVFYRFDIKYLHKIPHNKPIILSPNHVNAFIDPTILAMLLKNKVRFFARGDIFKSSALARWALNSMNISPMYRIQEGYAELKKNDKTFQECKTRLGNNETLLMFPEAICVQERRIRKLKKGLARIVFSTEDAFDFKKDVLVIPVALNYWNAKKIRSKLMIVTGKPISIKHYEQQYKEDKVKAINQFTQELEESMKELSVIIADKQYDKMFSALEEIKVPQWMLEKKYSLTNLEKEYEITMEMAGMVNYYAEEKPQLMQALKEEVLHYHHKVRKLKLRDHLLRPDTIEGMNMMKFIGEFLMIWLGLPIYIFSVLTNGLPYWGAKKFADTKIKSDEFHPSVHANLAMVFWLIFYGVQLITIGLLFRDWLWLGVFALLVPMSLMHQLSYVPLVLKVMGKWRLLRMVRKQKNLVEELMRERYNISEQLDQLRSEWINFINKKAV